jgi:hypothetical protein
MSADQVAAARREHGEATELHRESHEKLNSIVYRIGTIRSRLAEITSARIAGTATGKDADEFVLLNADSELLASMLTAAQQTVQERHALVISKTQELTEAEKAHALEQAGIEFTALSLKTQELEAVFVRAIALTHAAGKKLGHFSLFQSWKPSAPLDKAMRLNVPPEVI